LTTYILLTLAFSRDSTDTQVHAHAMQQLYTA